MTSVFITEQFSKELFCLDGISYSNKKLFYPFQKILLSLLLIIGLFSNFLRTSFDGLGKLIQTTSQGNTINYYYDPEAEFLELGHSVNGSRQWNLYGPDRSGVYGGAQGIGGLENSYDENIKSSFGIVNNYFGDVVGLMSGGSFTPYQSDLGSYGPMPGSSVNQAFQPQWRSHYLDQTGFICMGARYYDPQSGRFISPDPLGHGSSLGLYDYCNGDPVNGLDPDGRCVESGNAGAQAGWNNGNGNPISYNPSSASNPTAYSLAWGFGRFDSYLYRTGSIKPTAELLNGVSQSINWGLNSTEQALGIPENSLTAAAFILGPEAGGGVAGLRAWGSLRAGAAVEAIASAGIEESSFSNVPAWRFEEVRPAIRALKNAGLMPEKIREVIQSFQPGTLNTRTLTTDEFGIRFYGGLGARGAIGFMAPVMALEMETAASITTIEESASSSFPAGYQGGPGAMWKGENIIQESLNNNSLVSEYPSTPELQGTYEHTVLQPGEIIDRYGPLGGKWFSKPGTSYGARSIPPGKGPYSMYQVLKAFEVNQSLASPGFLEGQIGFGPQIESPVSASILIKRGIIKPYRPYEF